MKDQRYNLWYNNDLILEDVNWRELEIELGERGLHVDDVDIEQLDNDALYNREPEYYFEN